MKLGLRCPFSDKETEAQRSVVKYPDHSVREQETEGSAAGCFDSRLMLFPFPGAMTLDPPPPHPSNPFQADLRSSDDAGSGVEEWWMAAPRPAGLALCMPVRNPMLLN